ncbi:MAG: hypothetical protein HC846_04505 [Blastocatellia bacterium]|nr:hypothetical protein [Blastocatellia bacterium]
MAQETYPATEIPRFSPDGKQFVFTSTVWQKVNNAGKKLSGGIALMNTDGTNFRQVTKNVNGVNDRDASLSPDGKKIVFRRVNLEKNPSETEGDIYIINSDGSGLKQLSNHKADETFPEFTVDGKSVIFVREHYAGMNSPYNGELVSVNLQDFKEQILIAKEFRVKQAIPIPTGRGGFLIACAEIDESGKPLPKGSMLAVASPMGELNPKAFMKLPIPAKKLQIDQIVASFAPANTAFYVAASEDGWDGEEYAFKIMPKEAKTLPGLYNDVRYYFSLSPDGKQNVVGTVSPTDTLIVREFAADNFAGKEVRIKIKR